MLSKFSLASLGTLFAAAAGIASLTPGFAGEWVSCAAETERCDFPTDSGYYKIKYTLRYIELYEDGEYGPEYIHGSKNEIREIENTDGSFYCLNGLFPNTYLPADVVGDSSSYYYFDNADCEYWNDGTIDTDRPPSFERTYQQKWLTCGVDDEICNRTHRIGGDCRYDNICGINRSTYRSSPFAIRGGSDDPTINSWATRTYFNEVEVTCDQNTFGNDPSACEVIKGEWMNCAAENQRCTLPNHDGKFLVRYGAGAKYTYHIFASGQSLDCNNSTFGDPYPLRIKSCHFYTVPNIYRWTSCASENESCTLPSPGWWGYPLVVRYGADDSYHYKTFRFGTTVSCNNSEFGDPILGTVKSCAYLTRIPDMWVYCGDLISDCTLPYHFSPGAKFLLLTGTLNFPSASVQAHGRSSTVSCTDNCYYLPIPVNLPDQEPVS